MTFPSVRKWKKDSSKSGFRRVAPASRVYRGIPDGASYDYLSLHNVVSCEIESGEMDCKATSIIGPSADVFYVSPRSVYVWAADWWSESGKPSTVYKMPLDGGALSALSASGSPVDQFSFLEGDDGYLNVVVRSGARGAAMWNSEKSEGATALVRIPVNSFGDGSSTVPTSSYRSLPVPKGYTFQNRFIGSHLLYGTGSGWGDLERIQEKAVFVTPLHGEKVVKLPLGHGVDRIEALGSEAVIVGGDEKDLHFTSLRLSDQSSIADRYVLKDATQGELRSHGFFYKPSTTESGILGLPVRQGGRPGYEHIYEGSASVIYLENRSLRFVDVGSLIAKVGKSQDDGCRASCVDWYGNARPLFIGGRVFALLGYEVVEGSIHEGQIKEMQRTYFGPASNTKN